MAEESNCVEIWSLHEVTEIAENQGGGFRVYFNQINEKGDILHRSHIDCTYLFLAAGSIGTSCLLVKAKATGTLPKLNEHIGKFWGNNGDTFGTRDVGKETNPSQGGPATAAILHYNNPYSPQTLIVYPQPTETTTTITTLGMAIPDKDLTGEFRYDPSTQTVCLHWPQDHPGNQKLLDAANYTYSLLDGVTLKSQTEPTEIKAFYHCQVNSFPHKSADFSDRNRSIANGGVTAHPLGGAVMGKACDYFGRLFGYQGLYVVDGAFIPGSTAAANPAFTIAAFAERSLEKVIHEDIVSVS